jgi:hypothetical protein
MWLAHSKYELRTPSLFVGGDLLAGTMLAMNKVAPFLWFNGNAE